MTSQIDAEFEVFQVSTQEKYCIFPASAGFSAKIQVTQDSPKHG